MLKLETSYYRNDRTDVDRITPNLHGCIIELGAANLVLAERLLAKFDIQRYDYIEPVFLSSRAHPKLRRVAETVEQWVPPEGGYDFAIALDVIEHLLDPAAALAKLWQALNPDGQLIISVPNIGHYSIIRRLAFGEFEYADSGLLDRTHVRFFTPRGVVRLLSSCGFAICRSAFKTRSGGYAKVFPSLRCYQYLSVWKKAAR